MLPRDDYLRVETNYNEFTGGWQQRNSNQSPRERRFRAGTSPP